MGFEPTIYVKTYVLAIITILVKILYAANATDISSIFNVAVAL